MLIVNNGAAGEFGEDNTLSRVDCPEFRSFKLLEPESIVEPQNHSRVSAITYVGSVATDNAIEAE